MLKIIYTLLMLFVCTSMHASEKMYFDELDLNVNVDDDFFYIHTSGNVWLETSTIHRDKTGAFTYVNSISKRASIENSMQFEKKWKCPYCFRLYPIGTPCSYKDCPSKYK